MKTVRHILLPLYALFLLVTVSSPLFIESSEFLHQDDAPDITIVEAEERLSWWIHPIE